MSEPTVKLQVLGAWGSTDKTLSKSGKAADAAIVGEKFGLLLETVEIMASQTFAGFDSNADLGAYVTEITPAPGAIEIGKTYTVNWDGEEYKCVAYSNVIANPMIGNFSIVDSSAEDTKEPFLIVYADSEDGTQKTLVLATDATNSMHDVSITVEQPKIDCYSKDETYSRDEIDAAIAAVAPDESTTLNVLILEEQTVEGFTYNADYAAYINNTITPALFKLISGETYRVMWEDTEYECTAFSGELNGLAFTAIGNGVHVGLTGNDEPFLLAYVEAIDSNMMLADLEGRKEAYKVGIWQILNKPVLPAVSSADNGKALKVVDGAWAAADETTETEIAVFPLQEVTGFAYGQTAIMPAPFALTLGETYRVVWDGAEYKMVCQEVDGHPTLTNAEFASNGEINSTTYIAIVCTVEGDAAIFGSMVNGEPDTLTSHNVGIYQTVTEPALPAVSSADNGKILQVVDGAWVAVAVADSAVKTYVDDYISSALEGDY